MSAEQLDIFDQTPVSPQGGEPELAVVHPIPTGPGIAERNGGYEQKAPSAATVDQGWASEAETDVSSEEPIQTEKVAEVAGPAAARATFETAVEGKDPILRNTSMKMRERVPTQKELQQPPR